MKLKIRRDDTSAPETDEWPAMNDWFAELRDGRPAGAAGHGLAGPARDAGPRPETAAAAPPASRPAAGAGVRVISRAGKPQRAAIGDQLRLPVAWCEMGSCIGRHADPAALGEADVRARAISAGWRVDALGRLACPRCQQTSPGFRASRPVTLWDRDTALASAVLTVAVTRNRRAAGSPSRRAAQVIPAGQPAAISRQPATPGTAPETPWPPSCPPAGSPAQQEHATPAPRHRRREAPAVQPGRQERSSRSLTTGTPPPGQTPGCWCLTPS
jgi:hypothetical protein